MAAKLTGYKDVQTNLVSGLFDAVSAAGEIGINNYRVVLNMSMTEEKKRCRMGGWRQFGRNISEVGFWNQDLHDQLLGCLFYQRDVTEIVTSGGEVVDMVYPYFFPGGTFAGALGPLLTSGPYEGYGPDFHGIYSPDVEFNEWFMSQWPVGYPYQFFYPVYDPVPNTGDPDYYMDSYYYLQYQSQEPDTTVAPYSYGDLIPVYAAYYSVENQYCTGPYLYRDACREPITQMYQSVSDAGKRRLIVATSSRLYLLNERTGNYRVLADGLGAAYSSDNCSCAGRQWSLAQVGNIVAMSNNFDPVLWWKHDVGPGGCEVWSADYISDLIGLGIYRGKVLGEWKGFTFLGDVEVNGVKYPYRIYWSDFNSPLSWVPGGESLALYTDLAAGERVDSIQKLGAQLRVYTSKGSERAIYEVLLVGGEEVFAFRELYRGPDGLAFRNSLVNLGDEHVFLGEQGVFVLAEFDRSPRLVEWVHRAGGVIFNGLSDEALKDFPGLASFGGVNRNACDQAIGGFDTTRDTIWFSWPTDDHICANMSLRLNLKYRSASLVDHGFSAFVVHRPDYSLGLRDFMAAYVGCEPYLGPKEGEAYALPAVVDDPPAYIRNETEDPDLPPHEDSLCARLGGLTREDLCKSCDVDAVFLMASSSDRTIKEFADDVYYRERYIGGDHDYPCPEILEPADSHYTQDGYYSMMQSDANRFGSEEEKMINRVAIDFLAEPQTVPNKLYVQVGFGVQPQCLRWAETPTQDLACLTDKTDAEHEADGTRANDIAAFPTYRAGSYIAWRFYVDGTGGGACFNILTQHVRLKSGQWR